MSQYQDPTAPRFRTRPRPASLPSAAVAEPTLVPTQGYDIGYGKPPKQHRFKPGQSGNPKGRPKGARGVNALIREMLDEKVEITVKGRRRKIRHIKALLLKQMEAAFKGDHRAAAELIRQYRAAVPEIETAPAETSSVESEAADGTDEAILDAYRAMILAEAAIKPEERS